MREIALFLHTQQIHRPSLPVLQAIRTAIRSLLGRPTADIAQKSGSPTTRSA